MRLVNIEPYQNEGWELVKNEYSCGYWVNTEFIPLNKIPTFNSPHGKWEIIQKHRKDTYDISGVKTWATVARCSACGFTHHFIENHMCYSFCPSCGTKMEE